MMEQSKARKYMERAVEVMSASRKEARSDAKLTPLVGALICKADGSVEHAFRGELREGDHAEYGLLERKNRETNLEGAVLFTTLEPCAPGSRTPPKLGCAERIVLARIREVWIGIEDPDPAVDRKGIAYLQHNGVDVHLFDADLQERIRSENRPFIQQALERAATKRVASQARTEPLSTLELPVDGLTMAGLSRSALTKYTSALAAKRQGKSRRPGIAHLERVGLAERKGAGGAMPTGNSVVLFGRGPVSPFLNARVLATFVSPSGEEEIRDFDPPMVSVPDAVLDWIRSRGWDPIDRTAAQRRFKADAFYELVREGLANAIVHRDYSISGAKIQVMVDEIGVTIRSPGLPIAPVTLGQLQGLDAPSLSRNPVLHHVFSTMGLAEERGLGLRSMRDIAASGRLPAPRFAWHDPYLDLHIVRTVERAVETFERETRDGLSRDERVGLEFLVTSVEVTQREYAEHVGVTARTAQRHLRKLVETGYVRSVGSGPATRYEVVGS